MASYGRATAARKDYADAHFNRSLSLLTLGDYGAGFCRLRMALAADRNDRSARKPRQTAVGRPDAAAAEDHPGDGGAGPGRYHPVRPLPSDCSRGWAPTSCWRHRPNWRACSRASMASAACIARGAPRPSFDLHCPLGTLPLALRTEIVTIPAQHPLPRARARTKIAAWRARLGATAGKRIAHRLGRQCRARQ